MKHDLLMKMEHLQVKPEDLNCTCSTLCWCNDLSFRFPMTQQFDVCMSPAEMLEQFGNQMGEDDQKYLRSLLGRKFNP